MTPLPALDAAHVADFNAEGANASGVGDRELVPYLLAVAGACQDTTHARHAGFGASLRGSGSATVISDAFFSLAARAPAWSKESSSSALGSMPAGMDDTSPGGGSYMKPSAPPCVPVPRSSAFPHLNDGDSSTATWAHLLAHGRRVVFVLGRAQQLACVLPLNLLPAHDMWSVEDLLGTGQHHAHGPALQGLRCAHRRPRL
jgi:hypothetical protein